MALLIPGTAAAFERQMTPAQERAPIRDPVEWMRERLSEDTWSKQREIARAVAERPRVAVPACHGPGKSFIGSRLAAWWIDSHPLGTAQVVTSAPHNDQVKGILWRELQIAHTKGDLPGRMSVPPGQGAAEWFVGKLRVGVGRKPPARTNPTLAMQAFQGVHAEHLLVILDEATGIPDWLYKAALALTTGPGGRILAIGNPDDPSSYFAETIRDPELSWHIIRISAFDMPWNTGEPVSAAMAAGLTTREWVEQAEKDYGGTDNALYQSKVLGLVPDNTDDLVITPAMIAEAHRIDMPGIDPGAFALDVSRSAQGDETALYRQRGGVIRRVDVWKGLPITAKPGDRSTVQRTYDHVHGTPSVPVVVDGDGIGIGAYDGLVALSVRSMPFSASGPAHRPDRFDTRRSEIWWEFRDRMVQGTVDLDSEDTILAAQLMTPKFWQVGGRIHVETKKELAARGKRSPDRADAAIMATIGPPIDLRGAPQPGSMGQRPQLPQKEADQARDQVRAKPGEGAALRKRKW